MPKDRAIVGLRCVGSGQAYSGAHALPRYRELSASLRTLFLWEIGQPRIRRTEVRPICNRRAISDLLTPAR
ncbi:MAG: hypothetical protein ACRD3H_17195, partial [Terriglobales bacterium]